jgi:hypothetical protein
MKNVPDFFRTAIGSVLSLIEKPIMQKTVKEYLWGYQDPILSTLKRQLPQLVSNDQVSVFGSVVMPMTFALMTLHVFVVG